MKDGKDDNSRKVRGGVVMKQEAKYSDDIDKGAFLMTPVPSPISETKPEPLEDTLDVGVPSQDKQESIPTPPEVNVRQTETRLGRGDETETLRERIAREEAELAALKAELESEDEKPIPYSETDYVQDYKHANRSTEPFKSEVKVNEPIQPAVETTRETSTEKNEIDESSNDNESDSSTSTDGENNTETTNNTFEHEEPVAGTVTQNIIPDDTHDSYIKMSPSTVENIEDIRQDIEAFMEDDKHDVQLSDETIATLGNINNISMNHVDGEPFFPAPEEIVGKKILTYKTISPKNSKRNPMAYFSGILGLGSPIDVILPNSGFTIFIRHPEKPEIVEFVSSLENEKFDLGYKTSYSRINSFDDLHITRLVMGLLNKLEIHSTLDVPNPVDYILYTDFKIVQAAVIGTMFPKGFPLQIPCAGSKVIVNGNPKCNNVSSGTLGVEELIYVDDEKVHDLAKRNLKYKKPNSVSLEMYNELIAAKGEVVSKVEGVDVKFIFRDINYKEYLEVGVEVLEEARKLIYSAFRESDFNNILDDRDKARLAKIPDPKKREMTRTKLTAHKIDVAKKITAIESFSELVSGKNIFLNRIITGEEIFDNKLQNIGIVDTITRTIDGIKAFTKGSREFGDTNPVRIGIAPYKCGCGASRGDKGGIIPISLLKLLRVAVTIKN